MSRLDRREFLQAAAGGIGSLAMAGCANGIYSGRVSQSTQPNILWISCEDINPDLGCYGDSYAVSPNIDKLADEGVRYDNAFTTAGVCAPVRSTTITGMYQNSIGTCPMRCKGVPPAEVKCFPEYLRAAGYYCTNNSKTDYQFDKPFSAWDDCSNKGHWRNRPAGKPFFSVINLTTTHESRIRQPIGRKAKLHDPAKANVPPYYPDTPLVRNDLACYADNITKMDQQVADILKQLEEDGLAEDTIVWFWGDHGRGLPRCKRWVYDSGLRVPLLIRVPKELRKLANPAGAGSLKPKTVNDELVSFVDFAPTMLSLAGITIPKYMQGQAFLGAQKARKPRDYIYGAKDRIDEAPDLARAVHDRKYSYVRNFMWHVPYSVNMNYMDQMPSMQDMRRLNAEGKLKGAERLYFLPRRPVEELYDLEKDPYEINNLAGDPRNKKVVLRMRKELKLWMSKVEDVGLIPEPDFDAIKRPGDKYELTAKPSFVPQKNTSPEKGQLVEIICLTPGASIEYRIEGQKKKTPWLLYNKPVTIKPGQVISAKAGRIGFKDSKKSQHRFGEPQRRQVQAQAKTAHWRDQLAKTDMLERLLKFKDIDFEGAGGIPKCFKSLNDKCGSIRYWAVIGLHNLCENHSDIQKAKAAIVKLIDDDSWSVRIAAAHALCDWDEQKKGLPVLMEAIKDSHASTRHFAMVSLEQIGDKARPALAAIKAKLKDGYAGRVAGRIVARL